MGVSLILAIPAAETLGGNAFNLLYIIGHGSQTQRAQNSPNFELRRRRAWACYLTYCQNAECMPLFKEIVDIENLSLPSPEEEFEAGIFKTPWTTLNSGQSNGSLYAELIRIYTLW